MVDTAVTELAFKVDTRFDGLDYNALNAMLAIGRWKRHLGFYADGTNEKFSTYSMFTNHITNEATDGCDDQADDREDGRRDGSVSAA